MKTFLKYFKIISSVVFLVLLIACSTNQTGFTPEENTNPDQSSFSFKDDSNGKIDKYDVNFKDDEITSLFKNGERIPDDQIDEYEDLVYDKLFNLRNKISHHSLKFDDFAFNIDELDSEMKELEEKLEENKFHFNFDSDEFKTKMDELNKELKKLDTKKFNFKFDNEEFKENMEKLREEMRDLDLNENIDWKKFNLEMKELGDKLSEMEFDLPGIEFDLDELNKNLEKIEDELSELDFSELKKLGPYLEEVKTELIADGYIQSEDEHFELHLSKEKMIINDITVTDDVHKKYKEIYKKHFGKYPDKESDIIIK